jgi:hypothetical protein
MDNTTLLLTVSLSICIAMFGILATIGSLYGILVRYPRYRQKKGMRSRQLADSAKQPSSACQIMSWELILVAAEFR